jgi:hypothetical protein
MAYICPAVLPNSNDFFKLPDNTVNQQFITLLYEKAA